ncbi:MAG: Xaa-Pro aminopeptidase [Rhodospirillaceae bacterium]|nr:MAG: Xaa-Pro aminopeptidase [Rhodospirillaceae bacterium]
MTVAEETPQHDDGFPALAERLHALRAVLAKDGLEGFIVPRTDEHQNEHTPRGAERLRWLTGFSGSAGVAVVLQDRAAVFVDGRYFLQAEIETDATLFERAHSVKTSLTDWLTTHAKTGHRIGYDPWLHTTDGLRSLEKAAEQAGFQLSPCAANPIDALWLDRPAPPLEPVVPHFLPHTGQSGATKRRAASAVLVKNHTDATVLAAPDSIAWLLNIRGGDVPYTPLPLAFAILHANAEVDLFLDLRKCTPALLPHLGRAVRVSPSDALESALDALGQRGARVGVDGNSVPVAVVNRLRAAGAHVVPEPDPCVLPRACKNAVEVNGMRAAHRRDGVALVRFLCWLETTLARGVTVTELSAADHLERLRREGELFRGLSFATISAAGPNGAIVHYRATPATNRPLREGELYLVDSGGQYLDGTTDVTRTLALGPPDPEARRRFTQVLKGHIALARAVFPVGTTGSQLDVLARQTLWADGVDYDHSTGHGVGCYLNVHEGPHSIATTRDTVALVPGMVLSDEPGYYKAGAYGIRIENLLTVCRGGPPPGAERPLLGFEVLTLAPLDRALIDGTLLSQEEGMWLADYHKMVCETLCPLLDPESAAWLARATAPQEG